MISEIQIESSIIELSKRKSKLMQEIKKINQEIEFLKKQQEKWYEGDDN